MSDYIYAISTWSQPQLVEKAIASLLPGIGGNSEFSFVIYNSSTVCPSGLPVNDGGINSGTQFGFHNACNLP
jgi:hypothetical protein